MRETFETLDFIVPENTPVFAAVRVIAAMIATISKVMLFFISKTSVQ